MTQDDLIGKQFGEYRLEAFLAQGGMARVYRAVDVRLKRPAIVKVIDPSFHKDPDYIMRFEREAQAIARLDHPNIVRLYRFDKQDDWLYMAMQQIQGADLETILAGYRADNEFIDPADALRIVTEICSALDYAHQKGVIHRDIKPANILLNQQGTAFLTDFGLALVEEVGTRGEIFGSPHYIAPEQAVSSAKAVPQSDLYAIGVILFEMFTGDVPFNAPQPLDIALLHMSEPPPAPRELRPEINPEVEAVILKALVKDAGDRYQTGAELAAALDQALKVHTAASLMTKRPTMRRQTIPQLVAMNLEGSPLPPIPAEVAAAQPAVESLPIDEPSDARPAVAQKSKKASGFMWIIGVAALFLVALLCVAFMTLPALMNRLGAKGGATVNETSLPNGTQPIGSPVDSGTVETTATLEAASTAIVPPAQPPTQTPITYTLLFVRGSGKDSVILTNLSNVAFPLEPLRIEGNKNRGLNGSAWGLTSLGSHLCVGAWKDNGNKTKYDLPDSSGCTKTEKNVTFKKGQWFGEDAFDVYYNNKLIGTCGKDDTICRFKIVP